MAIILILCPAVDADFVSLSKALEFRYSGGGYKDELFLYRVFEPAAANTTTKWPLIVWLHGNCESQRDNIAHLKWLDQFVFRPPWGRGNYPFFLLAVQCPRDNPDWTQRSLETQDDMVNVAAVILEQTLRDYPIDRDRIYLSGVSSGGSGCWEFAIRHPEYFAALSPMGSGGGDNARIDRIKEIPVWAFHCSRDSQTKIDLVRDTVRTLQSVRGNTYLSEVDSEKHDCWTAAFNDYHLLEWLLSQRRGQSSPPPGAVPLGTRLRDFLASWRWWQAAAQFGMPAMLVLAVWNALKHRPRKIAKAA